MQQNRDGGQKLYSLFGRFSLIVLVCTSSVYSQESFKDFKRVQTDSFQKYKDERDTAFNRYLKLEWEAYNALEPIPLYEKPKPLDIEVAQPQEIKPVGPKTYIKIKDKKQDDSLEPKSDEIVDEQIEVRKDELVEQKSVEITIIPLRDRAKEESKDLSFDFYGSIIGFNIPSGIKSANFYPPTQLGIANFFNTMALSEYEPLLSDIEKFSKEINLNDWGVYLLVTAISEKLFAEQDSSRLFSWFIFNKLGYSVKVALSNKHIVLMHYSEATIYATPSYNFDGKKYYAVADYAKGSIKRVYSYKQEYPGAKKALDLSLKTLPNFVDSLESKTLSFSEFGNSYNIPITYNKNLLNFMATYPQAEYDTFFNAPIDRRTYKDLALSLKSHIEGKKASEAINFVLHFVQNAFKYEQDNKQFGREKVMFAQETLFFDRSDCEDRAILFSYLAKELFDLSVIGVKYKDHMATGLYIPLDGDNVLAGGRRYVIADPTYIDAPIGVSMPKYRSLQPQSFIVVKK